MGRASVGRGGTARVRGLDRVRAEAEELRRDEQNRETIRLRDYAFPSRGVAKTVDFTLSVDDKLNLYLLDTTSGNVTATLPLAANVIGYRATLVRSHTSNEAFVTVSGSDTIEGYSTLELFSPNEAITVVSVGGTRWVIADWKRTETAVSVTKTSGSYVLTALDEERTYLMDPTSGTVRIAMPPCDATTLGRRYVFKQIAAGSAQVRKSGSDTIEGAALQSLGTLYDSLVIYNPNGSGVWYIEV